jgi:IS5 family transposase
MRPRERRDSGQSDLFKARLDRIVDMNHSLAKLARAIDWGFLEKSFGAVYSDGPGQPPLATRLMAGLAILKHMQDLSDEVLCDRWLENPYFQLFCGEEFFCHRLPFDRSSLTRWRQRMGENELVALLQESLSVATRTGAAKPSDFTKVIVDTTVQEKAVAFPTDAKLMHRARERLVRLAKKHGVSLRQSYARVGKLALVKQQRYAHAKQFKRARRSLKTLKTFLGRVIRDIVRKIRGDEALKNVFAHPLMLARRVRAQNKNLRRVKGAPERADLRVFSLHAPEVECIGKGKAHKPYEFGVKASLATTLKRSKGGQFIVHAKALPGKPYDGHTLAAVIPEIERLVGADLERIIADRGYRGHNAPPPHRFKVYVSGQKRRVTEKIKRELRRRAAIEPVIGHLKAEHRMGRNHLAHATGDAGNAILAAVGYNFRRLLAWLALLLTLIAAALASRNLRRSAIIPLQTAIFTGNYLRLAMNDIHCVPLAHHLAKDDLHLD